MGKFSLLKFWGQICSFWKFIGVDLKNLEKYEDRLAKFEKKNYKKFCDSHCIELGNLKFFTFRCHLKFTKYNLNKIHYKFLPF